MIYCIDSNIIIWGIKKQATAGQEDNIPRAEAFFRKADEDNDDIVIPSIVIAEILAPETEIVRGRILSVLSQNFIIAPFDTRAALKYAEIMHGRFQNVKALSESAGIARQKMKADHMIIAIAIVNGANCIYSTDPGLKTFASGYIDIRDLPPIARPVLPTQGGSQRDLFTTLNEGNEKEEPEDEDPF